MGKTVLTTGSATITGIESVPVTVEALFSDQPGRGCLFTGLGDTAARETRERVWGACLSSGVRLPIGGMVNFSPAGVRKEGAGFDLALAALIIAAAYRSRGTTAVGEMFFFGELALDGRVLPVRAPLLLAACANQLGAYAVIVPAANEPEARLCCDRPVIGISHLRELVELLAGDQLADRVSASTDVHRPTVFTADRQVQDPFADVLGQERAKRALTIAAAGGHHVLLVGPPGCGKSMLAERTARLLPPLEEHEMLEAVRVHSLAGLSVSSILRGTRPFRAPHYASTPPGFVGGGLPFTPGELSLAHRGVLFLDEFPEYRRTVLESMRLPLERGTLRLSRAAALIDIPAQFQLIAAMNPCPCGKLGTPQSCQCSPGARQLYRSRLSQPILDRIDVTVELSAVKISELSQVPIERPSAREGDFNRQGKIMSARATALNRQGKTNHELSSEEARKLVPLDTHGAALIERASERFGLSARGLIRTLRVARTIADLDDHTVVTSAHLAEALSYRFLKEISAS